MILDPSSYRDAQIREFARRARDVAEALARYKRDLMAAGLSEGEAWELVRQRELELLGSELADLERSRRRDGDRSNSS